MRREVFFEEFVGGMLIYNSKGDKLREKKAKETFVYMDVVTNRETFCIKETRLRLC